MRNWAEAPERSIVTVLAVDTVDSTSHVADADPDEVQDLLDRIFAHVDRAVRGAGGLLVNFSGDGGVAVFGWPVSLEDHADRACEAAWMLQSLAGTRPIKDAHGRAVRFRVGLHSGLVGLRRMSLGTGDRLDTVGSTVYLAAALQKAAAPGGILLSSKTQELCQSDLDLDLHADVPALEQNHASVYRLKDRPVWPLKRYARRRYSVPLMGRLREREELRNALISRDAPTRAVAVIGEPGIGKSRLAAAAINDAEQGGMSVSVFYGDSQKRTTPYSAMRSLILRMLSLDEASSDDEIGSALDEAGIRELQDEALATVLLSRRPEKAPGSGSNSPTQTQVVRALVHALAGLSAGASTLLVIEDLHLLDLESIQCLRLVAAERGPWTLLVTGRPEALADARSITDSVIRLAPLPREEMRRLALALWPAAEPRNDVLESVLDRADGVPFVLEQIVLSIGVDGSDDVDLTPQSVQSVIHARLNYLSPAAKACAQALSVFGEEVETEIIRKVLDADDEVLQRDRLELEFLDIIHPSTEPTIRFRHAIVAQASAEMLPGPRRRALHQAAIGAITSTYADLSAHYERLAFHAEGARDDAGALEYLWLAGLRARRSSANGSLFLIFQQAMTCVERIGESANPKFVDFVLMACAQLLQIGEFGKMTPYLPRALELAQDQGRQDRVCAALCTMGTVSWFYGHYAESRKQCEEALRIAESLGSLPLIFAAKFMLASALWGMAEIDRAIALQFELRETFSGKLESARLGAIAIPGSMVRSYLSWFMMEVGRYEEGLPHVEEALEIAVRAGEPYSEMLARNGLGRNLMKLKRHGEAAACLEIAVSLIDKYGYDAIRPHVTGQLASALARIGEGERATRMIEAWLARGLEERTGRLEMYYLNAGYAEALWHSGEHEKALAAAGRALEIGRRLSNPCLIVQGLGLHAWLLSQHRPGDSTIDRNLAEQAELCRRHGLAAETWTTSTAATTPMAASSPAAPQQSAPKGQC